MEITINFQEGPLDVEIQATEEEDLDDVLGKLSDFIDDYTTQIEVVDEEESESPEDDEDLSRDSQSIQDIPIDQLTRVVKRGRVDDDEIQEFPTIIGDTNVLGDSGQEKLLHGAAVILGILDEFYDIDTVRTTELKDALAESGLDTDSWSNIGQVENVEVYFTRRGSGSSGTTELRPPGKEKAVELMNLLVEQIN